MRAEMVPKPCRAVVSPLLLLSLVAFSSGFLLKELKEPKQAWGYVPVRSNASMFWWLYYADNPAKNFTELPLILWLQGGPGASGCGYGNFEEIGPLDADLKPRRTTWVCVMAYRLNIQLFP
ncbi:UNVERIFIED_CONTAM: hypothetical protein K2H54_036241 [Gekko kuhli]